MPQIEIPRELQPGFAQGGPFRALIDGEPAAYFAQPDSDRKPPSPYFDPVYYRTQNHDCGPGDHPLLHYLIHHINGEERLAHPMFDAAEYAELNPDVAEAGAASLVHFALHGDAENRSPSRHFDANFYVRAYLPLEARRPLRHYLITGQSQGFYPRSPVRPVNALASALRAALKESVRPLLLISHDARTGGAPQFLLDLGRALAARGWEPITLLLQGAPREGEFARLGPCFNLAEGWDINDLASMPPVPTLASTVASAPVLAQIPLTAPRVLIVQEMVSYARDNGHLDVLSKLTKNGATALFLRPTILEDYRAALPPDVPNAALQAHLQGFVPRTVSCGKRLERARRMRSGTHVIGGGYGDYRKGFDLFLNTALLLHMRSPDMRFTWIGDLGSWARELADEALARGLPLELPGHVDDYPAWLAGADLFLLTSRQDPGPTLVAESLLQGTALVYFDGDIGLKDLISPLGAVAKDPETAALAVLSELAQDSAECRRERRKITRAQNDFSRYVCQVESYLING